MNDSYEWLFLCLALVSQGCSAQQPVGDVAEPAGPTTREVSLSDVGLDASIMDRSVSPCDDFYQFACGTWLATNKLPGDKGAWVRSYSEMDRSVNENLRRMLEELADRLETEQPPIERMLGTFYASCMDTQAIDALGSAPIDALLLRIEGAADLGALAELAAEGQAIDCHAFVGLLPARDATDSKQVVAEIYKNGWSLHPDDYRHEDASTREHYREVLERLLRLAGLKRAERIAKNALAIEALLSEKQDDKKKKTFTGSDAVSRLDLEELERLAPDFPWRRYLGALGLSKDVAVNTFDLPGIVRVAEVSRSQSLRALKDYVLARYVQGLSYVLAKPFEEGMFALKSRRWGLKNDRPRWETCNRISRFTLPNAVIRAYVARFGFDKRDPTVLALINDVYDAWRERLHAASWLDATTREAALRKLASMETHVGFPNRTPEEHLFERKSFAANVLQADRAKRAELLATIGRPPDPAAPWRRNPLEPNAYHDHNRNSIHVHLAMLTPPIWDKDASQAVQFGNLGMTIGHEVAHGFDHNGAAFDGEGNQRRWWTKESEQRFVDRMQCFIDEFSRYEIFPGVKIDGKRSAGENIADVAGLRVAFHAYRRRRAEAHERIVAEGFTEDQQFFLARAQSWCTLITDEAARANNQENAHIHPRWTVNGPLHHLSEFHEAFGCPAPKRVCTMW